jgi:hypothetical protein
MGIHAAIEFGNRMVTIAVAAIAVMAGLVVMLHRPPRTDLRRLTTFAALGVPCRLHRRNQRLDRVESMDRVDTLPGLAVDGDTGTPRRRLS